MGNLQRHFEQTKRISKFRIILTFAFLALGCGAEDDPQGEPIAQEIGGSCVFTPGDYVLSYAVLDTTPSCEGFEAFPDEYVSITSPTELVLPAGVPPMGCVDTPVNLRGCFAAVSRECSTQTVDGLAQIQLLFQLWLDDGEGVVRFDARLFSGPVLLDACTVNLEVTIRPRR